MNFTEYQKLAIVTKQKWPDRRGDLANCGLGIAGEAGEVAEIIKKQLSGVKELDAEKLKYELGDVLWYIASLCDCLGFDMGTVAEMNIAKLKARHGAGFSGMGKR